MKTLQIRCVWETSHEVEVPDDYEPGSTLDEEWADQVDTSTASLVDWEWATGTSTWCLGCAVIEECSGDEEGLRATDFEGNPVELLSELHPKCQAAIDAYIAESEGGL